MTGTSVVHGYVKNLSTGSLTLVSKSSAGTPANASISNLQISTDGRYVIFFSTATNLVASDTNARGDIFRHDLDTGTTVRVSTGVSGTQLATGVPAGSCANSYISGNGRYVAFTSTTLASGVAVYSGYARCRSGSTNVYLKDVDTNDTICVSGATDGSQDTTNFTIDGDAMSEDGRYVMFSGAGTLAGARTTTGMTASTYTSTIGCFRYDTYTGQLIRLSNSVDVTSTCAITAGGLVGFYGDVAGQPYIVGALQQAETTRTTPFMGS